MEISNNDLALLLKNQEDILEIMHENQILLTRLEEYIRLLLVHNLVNDYDNIILQHNNNEDCRKLLTSKIVGILRNRLYALDKARNCYENLISMYP